jgi:hypothetical protein
LIYDQIWRKKDRDKDRGYGGKEKGKEKEPLKSTKKY